jgi:hypothetical protein
MILNYESFQSILALEGSKKELDDLEDNSQYNTVDLMKNYLDSQEMKKVLDHITHNLNCTRLTNIVLTANNLSTLAFISNGSLSHL